MYSILNRNFRFRLPMDNPAPTGNRMEKPFHLNLEGKQKVEISVGSLVAFLAILVLIIIISVSTTGNIIDCLMPEIYMLIAKLLTLVARGKCEEGYFFRLIWACLSLTVPVIVLIAIHCLFPKYKLRLQRQKILPKGILPKISPLRRPVSVKVCTSTQEENVQQLITEISSRFKRVHEVKYYPLPYNDIDSFSFQNKDFDVIILCHSIHNRRFAITDVLDSLYDKFLANAEISLGKEKVCVIVHDFPKENWSEQRNEDEMTAFRLRQPSTFKHSNLALMAGRLDRAPAELSQDQWNKLHVFIDQAEVAGRPHVGIDYVPTLLIASLMVVLFFVPALMKNKYLVMLFVVTLVAAVTCLWPRIHIKWSLGTWLVENVLNCIFQLSPSSWMMAMLLSGVAVAIVTFLALFDTFYMQEQNFKRTMRRVLNYIKRRGGEDPAYETKDLETGIYLT